MPEADGYVRISTKFDDASLTRSLSGLGAKMNKALQSLEKAKSNVAELEKQLENISTGKTTPKSITSLEKEIEKAEKSATGLEKQIDALSTRRRGLLETNFGGMHDAEITDLNEQIDSLTQKLMEAYQNVDTLKARLAELKADPSKTVEAEETARQLELARSEVERLSADIHNTRAAMDSLRDSTAGVKEEAAKSESAFSKLGGMIKRLARRMLLLYAFRRVFTFIRNSFMSMTGFSVVTGELSDFINKMKQAYSANVDVQKALAGLRGALYTSFAPIYSAVVPALVSLINWLARGIAYISAFISALGGGSFAESAKGADKLSKSIGGVGGAAKKANEQLAAFDKLNVLNEDKGGGGGGSPAGGVSAADEIPGVDEEKLAAWENFGNRINEIITNIKTRFKEFSDWFDQASPGQKIIFLSVVLGTLIPLLWLLLPWPLAMAASLIILFTLVEKYYDQITAWLDGAYNKIQEFFSNAVNAINSGVDNAKKWISEAFSWIEDNVNGFITNIQNWLVEHWGFIGKILASILGVVKVAITTATSVLSTGLQIVLQVVGTALSTAYLTVQTVINLIVNVIRAVVETIHAIATGDWSKAWEAWGKVFSGVWNGIKAIVVNVVNGIIGIVESMVNGIISIINGLLGWVNSVGSFFGAHVSLGVPSMSLPRFAAGGFPDAGSMFVAGEAGPELVGSFGGHNNTVVNEAQLVQAFQQASSEQVALLQQQNSLLAAILNKSGEVTFKPSSAAGKVFSQSINMYSRAMGV